MSIKEIYSGESKSAEFIRFCIVGVIATALDAAIFYLVRLFASYQIALVSGYCLSLIVNYLLTIYWTFKKKPSTGNLFGVIAAHMFNLFVVRMSLMWIFVNIMEIPDRIAYIPTLLISMVTNFLVVRFAVNKTEEKKQKQNNNFNKEYKMAKTVYLGMIGDIMHPGYINIINEGAKYGDVIIGLFTDKAIANHRRLPYLTWEQRKTVVEQIKNVSKVVAQEEWSYIPNLIKYKPDYIIHGDDWKTGPEKYLRDEVYKVMEEINGHVIEIPYTKGITASSIQKEIGTLGVTPQMRLSSLRRLIAAKPIVRILESHNGLTGLIAEHTKVDVNGQEREFDGMWASSLTDSTSKGKPDIEAVDLTTRLHDLNDTLEVTTKPVIFDGDTGGKVEHFVFTVRTLERLGISCVIIEDKTGLKQNSLFGTDAIQTQDTIEGFCRKIRAGKEAQITRDFMIVSRCESLIAGKTVDDALERCHAYVEAGVDGVMIHSKEKSGEDIKEFCTRFREKDDHTPIIVVPTTFNQFTEEELATWGINVVIYANHMLRSAYPAMLKCAETILRTSRSLEASEQYCMPIKEILNLIPGTKIK